MNPNNSNNIQGFDIYNCPNFSQTNPNKGPFFAPPMAPPGPIKTNTVHISNNQSSQNYPSFALGQNANIINFIFVRVLYNGKRITVRVRENMQFDELLEELKQQGKVPASENGIFKF